MRLFELGLIIVLKVDFANDVLWAAQAHTYLAWGLLPIWALAPDMHCVTLLLLLRSVLFHHYLSCLHANDLDGLLSVAALVCV
jgi:hypothetical protein